MVDARGPGDTAEAGQSSAGLAGARAARPGQFVHHARRLQQLAADLLVEAVIAERAKGTSWQQIGDELGVTRATAHGRFGEAVKRREVGTTNVRRVPFGDAWRRLNDRWNEVRTLLTEQAVVHNLGALVGSFDRSTPVRPTVDADIAAILDSLRGDSADPVPQRTKKRSRGNTATTHLTRCTICGADFARQPQTPPSADVCKACSSGPARRAADQCSEGEPDHGYDLVMRAEDGAICLAQAKRSHFTHTARLDELAERLAALEARFEDRTRR